MPGFNTRTSLFSDPGLQKIETRQRSKDILLFSSLSLGLLLALILACALGNVQVPFFETVKILYFGLLNKPYEAPDSSWSLIVLFVRLPRVLGAWALGAALALSGAAMQGIFRNPMADPGIAGVSGGAGFGAIIVISSGLASQNLWFTPIAAFLGAFLGMILAFSFSFRKGRLDLYTLILAGMVVSTFFSAASSLILSFSSKDSVSQYIFWTLGSLYNVNWDALAYFALPMLPFMLGLLFFARDLNLLLLGEEDASALGLPLPRLRVQLMLLASILCALGVCLAGPVGFIGLLVPHLLRFFCGNDYRRLLPASLLGGGIFLILCDLIARIVLEGQEIQVGIVTSLLGAPYFMALLIRSRKQELGL